jgi:hypothetical protein
VLVARAWPNICQYFIRQHGPPSFARARNGYGPLYGVPARTVATTGRSILSRLSHAVAAKLVSQFNAASRPNYVGGLRQRGRPRVGVHLPAS